MDEAHSLSGTACENASRLDRGIPRQRIAPLLAVSSLMEDLRVLALCCPSVSKYAAGPLG